MPGKPEPISGWRTQIGRLLRETGRLTKTAFVAAGLLLLSAGLTYTVLIGVKDQLQPLPPLAKVQPPTESPSLPATGGIPRQDAAREIPKTTPTPAVVSPAPPLALNIPDRMVSVPFGWRHHPVYHDWRLHTGVDMAATDGQPVQALVGGQVTDVIKDPEMGLTVIVSSDRYELQYASLATAAVSPGTAVAIGQRIGTAGHCPAEPFVHVHLAVKQANAYLDPQRFAP